MNKNILFCLSLLLLLSAKAGAQDSFSVRAQRYIEQYYVMAMAEQQRAGIPASVTLAQGVLETEAGRSELACSANNHFGIKCKPDYQGDKFFHDDDAPKECFKMYKCAQDSYKDHSDYLKRNQRYSPLFALSQTDYASWAVCLRKCGYATNPQYAQRLIKIIEDFKLQQYTYAAMDTALMPTKQPLVIKDALPIKETARRAPDTSKKIVLTTFDPPVKNTLASRKMLADTSKKISPAVAEAMKPVATTSFSDIKAKADSAHHILASDGPLNLQARMGNSDTPMAAPAPKPAPATQASIDTKYDSGKVITVNGLKAIYAYKGEMLLQYAVKYNIRYPHLLEINDLEDGPLTANMPIYLEKKLSSGTHARHTVRDGETSFLIAQAEGLQLKRMLALNMMDIGDEPAVGVILELQNGVFRKPALRAVTAEAKGNTTTMLGKSTPPADLITISRPKPVVKLPEPVKQPVAAQPYVETIAATKPTAPATAIEDTTDAGEEQATTTTVPAKEEHAVVKPDAQLKEDTVVDELANLKAELDKVVYTDDSKLMGAKPTATRPVAAVKPVPKPAMKPAHKGKKSDEEEDDEDEDDKKKSSNYYTIKNGETLGGIANRHNTTVKKLMQLNHIKDVDIRAGKKLRVK